MSHLSLSTLLPKPNHQVFTFYLFKYSIKQLEFLMITLAKILFSEWFCEI